MTSTFVYRGEFYDLADYGYNNTLSNERAVELPIAQRWLARQSGVGLEVGNVMSHYFPVEHEIVDKYEQARGVRNADVFTLTGKYDWVLSISTLEHVGWDETPVDVSAAAKSIEHLVGCLAPKGRMLVTIPVGYHPHLDAQLLAGVGADRECCLVRDADGWSQHDKFVHRDYDRGAWSLWVGEWGPA
jgi:SAM-dependent methyltransferase